MANVAVTIPAKAQPITTTAGGLEWLRMRAFATSAIDETSGNAIGFVDGTALFTQVKSGGNGKAVEQTVELTITDTDSSTLELINNALLNDLYVQVIAKPKASTGYYVFGLNYGLRAEITHGVGAKLGDLNGSKIVLKGIEDQFAMLQFPS